MGGTFFILSLEPREMSSCTIGHLKHWFLETCLVLEYTPSEIHTN